MISLKVQSDRGFMRREYFTQNGRAAFKIAIQSFGLSKEDVILLPAYIGITDKEGSGVLDPIEESGASYAFYSVNERLEPVIEDLREKIRGQHVKAVLVIHYFGFPPRNFDAVVALCHAEKKLLIEDCAHALYSYHQDKKLGTFGDASFFSIHKFLSTDTGGLLSINNPEIKVPEDFADDIQVSALASYCRADVEKISATRRGNYEYLQSKLGNIKPFFDALPEGVVPMNFPILVEGMDRNNFYFKLQEKGVPTSTLWYRLVEQIQESDFPVSYDISRHISNLPIHQGITHTDIDSMLEAVRVVLAGKV